MISKIIQNLFKYLIVSFFIDFFFVVHIRTNPFLNNNYYFFHDSFAFFFFSLIKYYIFAYF